MTQKTQISREHRLSASSASSAVKMVSTAHLPIGRSDPHSFAMPESLEGLKSNLADRYQFDRELTGGGMSRVFVAHERSLGRNVVVKVLAPELAGSVNLERFRREVQLAARLQHAHIV